MLYVISRRSLCEAATDFDAQHEIVWRYLSRMLNKFPYRVQTGLQLSDADKQAGIDSFDIS